MKRPPIVIVERDIAGLPVISADLPGYHGCGRGWVEFENGKVVRMRYASNLNGTGDTTPNCHTFNSMLRKPNPAMRQYGNGKRTRIAADFSRLQAILYAEPPGAVERHRHPQR